MFTKQDILKTLNAEFQNLNKKFNVKRIGLFGSYSENMANNESDIDLIVEFEKPIGLEFMNLCSYLEKLFNKEVDVMTVEGLNNIRIQSVKENILNSIEYVQAS